MRSVLPDTSMWIGYFRSGSGEHPLAQWLEQDQVVMHPWVIGELSLGNLGSGSMRAKVLADLENLPSVSVRPVSEMRLLVEERGLWSSGLGWVDVQLLAAALVGELLLETSDKVLASWWAKLSSSLRP